MSAWSAQVREIATDPARDYADSTRELLLEAADSGEMTFAMYERGVLAFYACVEDAGLTPLVGQPATGTEGLPLYSISYQFPAGLELGDPRVDELDALANRCDERYLSVVETTYVTQPVAIASLDRRFESYRSGITACLTDAGIEVDPGASRREIEATAAESEAGLACFEDSGFWD